MSPLNSLQGAQYEPSEQPQRKKEEGRRKTLKPWVGCRGRTKLYLLYYCIIVYVVIMGGRVNLFARKVTAIVKLYHYS